MSASDAPVLNDFCPLTMTRQPSRLPISPRSSGLDEFPQNQLCLADSV